MEDLPADPEFQNADPKDEVLAKKFKDKLVSDLPYCRWFSRGWTLQELIAPRELVFYDESWLPRGSKHTLSEDLSRITGIDLAVLQGVGDLSDVPVARRMAWAAPRKTTRVEDLAYCLLGIFDVNMPLIYGEAKKAFIRLQEAIAQGTDDFSLFAWSSSIVGDVGSQTYRGMFAESPSEFWDCRQLELIRDPLIYGRQSFTITNRGLQFQALLRERVKEGDYLMNLYCQDRGSTKPEDRDGVIVIRLRKGPKGFVRHQTKHFIWVKGHQETNYWGNTESQEYKVRDLVFEVPKTLTCRQSDHLAQQLQGAFHFHVDVYVRHRSTLHKCTYNISPPNYKIKPTCWDPITRTFFTGGFERFTSVLKFTFSFNITEYKFGPHGSVLLLFGLVMPKTPNENTPYAEPWIAIHDWKQKQPRGPKFTEFLEKELTYGFPYDNIHCDYANLSSMAGEAILADFEEGHSLPASCFLRTREDTKEDLNLSLSLSSRRGQGNGPWDVQVMVEYLDKSCTGPMLELQPEQDPMLDLRLRRTTAGMHQ
jgi:hypothetical protein